MNTPKTNFIKFRPTSHQEKVIISNTIDWVRDRHSSNEEAYLILMLTNGCNINSETYSVQFRTLYNKLASDLSWTTDKQRKAFTKSALWTFLCRVIGTTPSYKLEAAHKHRREYFDLCVNTKPVPADQVQIGKQVATAMIEPRPVAPSKTIIVTTDRKTMYKDLTEIGFTHDEAMEQIRSL